MKRREEVYSELGELNETLLCGQECAVHSLLSLSPLLFRCHFSKMSPVAQPMARGYLFMCNLLRGGPLSPFQRSHLQFYSCLPDSFNTGPVSHYVHSQGVKTIMLMLFREENIFPQSSVIVHSGMKLQF